MALMSSPIHLLALEQQRPTYPTPNHTPPPLEVCFRDRQMAGGESPLHFTSSRCVKSGVSSEGQESLLARSLSRSPAPALHRSAPTGSVRSLPSNFPLPQHNVLQSQLALNQNSFSNLPHDPLSLHNAVNCE